MLYEQLKTLLVEQPQHGRALCILGCLYEMGVGAETDIVKAIELFERAIALNDAAAMFHLAYVFHHGQVTDNYPCAIELYEKAIMHGHAGAMFYRAVLHSRGKGGPVNDTAAIKLYDQAMAVGDYYAMLNRSSYCATGKGEPDDKPNPLRAARLCLKIVEAGITCSAEALSRLYSLAEISFTPYTEIHYLLLLGMLHLKKEPISLPVRPDRCLGLLANDASMPLDTKLNYFSRIWLNPKADFDYLEEAPQIETFGWFQIQIAKQALRRSVDVNDNTQQQHIVADQAFELAKAAREKLHKIANPQAQRLHDNFHKQLVIALCESRLPTVQTDPQSFAHTIIDLRSPPVSLSANSMLMKIVQVANIEPFFSAEEKRQLLLALEDCADFSRHDDNVLLHRLDDLADYYITYPERFPTTFPAEVVITSHSPHSFHARGKAENSNNDNTRSVELKKIMPLREEFAEFRKQHHILKTIDKVLKSYTPGFFGVALLSWISQSAEDSRANDAHANNLTALQKSCQPPHATAVECVEKTIDYLSALDLDKQPISPIISNLLQKLSHLLGTEANNNSPSSPSRLRNQICNTLKTYLESTELSEITIQQGI